MPQLCQLKSGSWISLEPLASIDLEPPWTDAPGWAVVIRREDGGEHPIVLLEEQQSYELACRVRDFVALKIATLHPWSFKIADTENEARAALEREEDIPCPVCGHPNAPRVNRQQGWRLPHKNRAGEICEESTTGGKLIPWPDETR